MIYGVVDGGEWSGASVAEHQALLDAIHVGRVDRGSAAESAAAFGALGLAQVPPAGTGAHDFPAGRDLKSLGRGLLRLDAFRTSHKSFSCLSKRAGNIGGRVSRIKRYLGLFLLCAEPERTSRRSAEGPLVLALGPQIYYGEDRVGVRRVYGAGPVELRQNPDGNRRRLSNWSLLGGSPGQKAVCSLASALACARRDGAATA